MSQIYCISGFGADERVFSKLDFGDHSFHFIPWLEPFEKEELKGYAKRMGASVHDDEPVLVGLSFGGMMSIEIAKNIKTKQVIIISSVKTFHEIPLWMRVSGKWQLDKFFPLKTFPLIEPLENYNLGIENGEERKLAEEYRKNISRRYTDWAAHQVITWKNEWTPANLVHIHGGKDHIFPIRNIKADFVIEDGGHFMIMNRADIINKILKKILT